MAGLLHPRLIDDEGCHSCALGSIQGTGLPGIRVLLLGNAGGRAADQRGDLGIEHIGQSRDGIGGVVGADDGRNVTLADEKLHARHRTLGIVHFIGQNQLDGMTQDAAFCVDLIGSQLKAVFHILADHGTGTGHRGHHANLDGIAAGSTIVTGGI